MRVHQKLLSRPRINRSRMLPCMFDRFLRRKLQKVEKYRYADHHPHNTVHSRLFIARGLHKLCVQWAVTVSGDWSGYVVLRLCAVGDPLYRLHLGHLQTFGRLASHDLEHAESARERAVQAPDNQICLLNSLDYTLAGTTHIWIHHDNAASWHKSRCRWLGSLYFAHVEHLGAHHGTLPLWLAHPC